MSEAFKNITIFIESRQNDYTKPTKIGNLFLNRFTIEEEPSFELLGIYNLMDPGSSAKRIETKVKGLFSKYSFRLYTKIIVISTIMISK